MLSMEERVNIKFQEQLNGVLASIEVLDKKLRKIYHSGKDDCWKIEYLHAADYRLSPRTLNKLRQVLSECERVADLGTAAMGIRE